MEKSWENFWTTGKVEDYLTYRNRVENEAERKQQREDVERQNERKTRDSWNG